LQLVQSTRQTLDLAARIQAKMRHMFDDQVSPIDWSTVETNYGIPTGSGEEVYTLVDGLQGSLQGVFQVDAGKKLTESVG
jgi:hypothetical protein